MNYKIKHPSRDNERGKSKSKRLYSTSQISQCARITESESANKHVTHPKHISHHLVNVLNTLFENEAEQAPFERSEYDILH